MNHLNSWGQFSWIVAILLICWDVIFCMHRFSVSVKKEPTLLQIVFVNDVNSWRWTTHEYHKYWAMMDSNDSTVACMYIIFLIRYTELATYFITEPNGCHWKIKKNFFEKQNKIHLTCIAKLHHDSSRQTFLPWGRHRISFP